MAASSVSARASTLHYILGGLQPILSSSCSATRPWTARFLDRYGALASHLPNLHVDVTRHTQSPRRCSSDPYSKISNKHVRNFVFSLHRLGDLEQADMICMWAERLLPITSARNLQLRSYLSSLKLVGIEACGVSDLDVFLGRLLRSGTSN